MPETLTEEQLRALCLEWQERLRLQDWDVVVYLVRERDLEGSGSFGEISRNPFKKHAVIRIVDGLDHSGDDLLLFDPERTLVHELLHIHTCPLEPDEKDELRHQALEVVIHQLSQALVKLKRETLRARQS